MFPLLLFVWLSDFLNGDNISNNVYGKQKKKKNCVKTT